MRTGILFILFSFSAWNHAFCKNEPFVIPTKTIVPLYIQDPKAPDLVHASGLLKKYVFELVQSKLQETGKASGKKWICLKQNPELHPDGFMLSVEKNRLIIEGGTRKGTTYGVIHLLESLGCKYLSPDFQVVPRQSVLTIPHQKISEKPVNDVRIINLYFPENEEYRDWLRLNTIEERYPEGYFVHTFHRLVPWETYFSSHPDYFALVNGKRSIDQLCPSNPEVRNLIARKLETEMKLQPGKQTWSVSQNDNFSYCHCDQCLKMIEEEGSPSGPIISLVNDIAARFPDKTISTLAYQYSRKAPSKIKPLKNVEVMLCTIELHRQASIDQNPECADFKKDMEDWGTCCQQLFLWDYTINFNHSISPFPNLHTLQPNILFFAKNHVNALFEQSNSTTGYEFSELKAWLLSKLLWNPNLDVNKEIREFTELYYGAASQAILDYIGALETALKETESKLWIYEHPVVHQNDLFSADRMEWYKQLFDQAEQAVQHEPVYLNHVQVTRLPIQYAAMEIAVNNLFSERGWYQLRDDGKTIPNAALQNTLEQFEKTCQQNQVPTINESGLTPADYIRSLQRMIDIDIEGNLAFGKKISASVPPDPKYLNGDLSYLSNGVNGASDYNIHWLGWFGKDTELILDLEKETGARNISINSLWNGKSWILHPAEVACSVSLDGTTYFPVGSIEVTGEQEKEELIRSYVFHPENRPYRYVKLRIKGTGKLFNWHPSAGEPSWFFLDEISVRN